MKFVDHNNADIFFDSYASELSTVNEMISYWNKKRRIVHLEEFRELSLYYHSQLLQSLFAKVEVNLNNCVDFIFINKKIEILRKKLRSITIEDETQSARARQKKLYWRKRQLVFEKLSRWQQIQSRKIVSVTKNEASQVASLSSYFNRIRRLNSSRDRLTSLLFLNVSLRSVQSRSALQNMITLCKENPRIVYRSSLRSANDHCSVPQCARNMNRFVCFFFLISQMLSCCELTNHSSILQHQYER